ncbi:acyl carrier protein 1, mitochondrial [Tanacetum coccineum]
MYCVKHYARKGAPIRSSLGIGSGLGRGLLIRLGYPVFVSYVVALCLGVPLLGAKLIPEVHFQKDLGADNGYPRGVQIGIPDKEADKIDSCALAIECVHNHPMAS